MFTDIPPCRNIASCSVVESLRRAEDLMVVTKANEEQGPEPATTKVLDLMAAEPAYRMPLYKALALCTTPRTASQVQEAIATFPEMKVAVHPPRILLAWLVQAGGIAQCTPDAGEIRWQTTAAGQRVLALQSPSQRLYKLCAQEPAHADIYRRVLAFCQTPRARAEIETLLQGDPVMESAGVYASFFVQGLEAAGGLEWEGKWRTTEAGKGVIA
jgi:hypothetical protein